MKARQDFRALWTSGTRLARASLVFAALNAALALCSWLPVGARVGWAIYPLHVGMILLMVSGFILVAWKNFVGLFKEVSQSAAAPLPRSYWICLGLSIVYLIAVFAGYAVTSPPRTPLGPAAGLRIASSAYLFVSVGVLGIAHGAVKRPSR